ncbi:hypothetical protein MHYP_G00127890 [Metynnis hypsauchen]
MHLGLVSASPWLRALRRGDALDGMVIEILHGRGGSAKQNVAVPRSYGDKKSQEQSLPELKTIKLNQRKPWHSSNKLALPWQQTM